MASRQVVTSAGSSFGRPAALAGVAFSVVIVVINGYLLPNAPYPADSSQKILSYLAGHQGQLQASAVLGGLAAIAVLMWVPGLFRTLKIVEDEASGLAEGETPGPALAALGGGILTAASAVTLAIIGGTTASQLKNLGPAGARTFWTMLLISRAAILVGLLVIIGATAVVCLQARLPRWFTAVSAVVALVSAVGACTLGYTATWIEIVASSALYIAGAWIVLVSVSVWPGSALKSAWDRIPGQTR